MKIRIIAVGKIKEQWILDGIREYAKRIKNLELIEIKDSIKAREADKILELIKNNEQLIIMSEEGQPFRSEEFAFFIKQCDKDLCFVVGSADGIDDKLKLKGALISLSFMTFTHEMARLFLVEQIYRAQSIIEGKKYHRK